VASAALADPAPPSSAAPAPAAPSPFIKVRRDVGNIASSREDGVDASASVWSVSLFCGSRVPRLDEASSSDVICK